ncbi:putative nucleic acid-binding Zn-ribbon protein [Dysgonomonas sp. PFB1-18]|uniref:zinc ribbon domain-containing protein n=1 Tax=unclassified Dysgonomonas TaxID=2630389 RepID=UPI0024753C25|nr:MULTISPECIES: C4-type zinc ribbon domain-containing protein [unclassified Dysgonomonas]MDH6308304.1 putative nucleic acid-binding Zn-ribbon protein [Dysgonomonas sp. PF1-14]MDH6338258.1 putative nucleic acid-binding Zn-ribbon protein [Dysgonomonas sp. PF1-16]MDH6379755.1 putative nucleic acid-binding Zn-ribbon protein [Dysgonomonas sp. PFB1-18]MDH6397155.1 putative nucleic acid-binding Zn-ribbon protein [Dysgonomonas sp. PF1-23]
MAKKQEKEVTVEDKLKTLYSLQQKLSEIDNIKILRGELPLEVADLEDEIIGLETRIKKYETELKDSETAVSHQKQKAKDSALKIEKYKEQLDNVRNNREFDHLSKEIEFETLEIELSDKRVREFSQDSKNLTEQVEKSKSFLEERSADLAQKKEELDGIVSETKQQEEQLREEVKDIESEVEPRLLQAFKRIRKSARNGLAVVMIERGACGGCFNKIPPQKQMDIKIGKKIIVCEYCGRIMIDPELVGAE